MCGKKKKNAFEQKAPNVGRCSGKNIVVWKDIYFCEKVAWLIGTGGGIAAMLLNAWKGHLLSRWQRERLYVAACVASSACFFLLVLLGSNEALDRSMCFFESHTIELPHTHTQFPTKHGQTRKSPWFLTGSLGKIEGNTTMDDIRGGSLNWGTTPDFDMPDDSGTFAQDDLEPKGNRQYSQCSLG